MSIRTFLTAGILGGICICALMATPGCRSGSTFVEGTRFRMGVYVPWDGSLYGLQFCEYLNGTAVLTPSNGHLRVTREYAATNSYLGVVHTQDATKTTAETMR